MVRVVGGLKALAFVIGTIMLAIVAMTEYETNFLIYMNDVMNVSLLKSVHTETIFSGTSIAVILIVAVISDSYIGRFKTILAGLFIYALGLVGTMILVMVLRAPPACPTLIDCQEGSTGQLSILWIVYGIYSIGSNTINASVMAFAADQIEFPDSTSAKHNFASLFYSPALIGALIVSVLLYYIKTEKWSLIFGMQAMIVGFAIVVFVSGWRFYRKVKPTASSPVISLAKVSIAAFLKRNQVLPPNRELLFHDTVAPTQATLGGSTVNIKWLSCLDKAAIITAGDNISRPNLWRIATVQRVDELKSILILLPIWFSSVVLVSTYATQAGLNTLQARTLNRNIIPSSSFNIPIAFLPIIGNVSALAFLVLYEHGFVPLVRKITKNGAWRGLNTFLRIEIGLVAYFLATILQALTEIKRKSVAKEHKLLDKQNHIIPMSVYWLFPQILLHGLGQAFVWVGQLEILSDRSPESIKSTSMTLYWVALSAGQFLSFLYTIIVVKLTGNKWLHSENFNRGKLENYQWFMAVLQGLNIIYFAICAHFYTRKKQELQNIELGVVTQNIELNSGSERTTLKRGESSTARDGIVEVETDEITEERSSQ